MPAPGSGIDINNLILPIARIKLKLRFSKSVESDTFQKPSTHVFHNGLVRGFDKCAEVHESPSLDGHWRIRKDSELSEFESEECLIVEAFRTVRHVTRVTCRFSVKSFLIR